MTIAQINIVAYYFFFYTPLVILILAKADIFKKPFNKIINLDIEYRGGNTFFYFLDVYKVVTITLYFAFGLIGSVIITFGAFNELKSGINTTYYIFNGIRGFLEYSLVATFAVSIRFKKPFLVALYSYLLLNIYYKIFGNFIGLQYFWKDYMISNIIAKISELLY